MTVSVASSPSPLRVQEREREGGGAFLLVPSYPRRYPLHSTTVIPCPLVSPVRHLPPPPHPHYAGIGAQSPPQPSPPLSRSPTNTSVPTAGPREPLSEVRETMKEKKEVQDERETERGGGDYVGRRKRGDKEAKSNSRRDEQDGETRRPRMRTKWWGDEGRERERERTKRESERKREGQPGTSIA